MDYKFTIDGIYYKKNRTLPALNDYLSACRQHPQAGATMKRQYQMVIANKIRNQLGKLKLQGQYVLHYTYYEADKRRDKDNISGVAHKFVQDTLIECGVLTDDGWDNVAGFIDTFRVDKQNPRIEVVIQKTNTYRDWLFSLDNDGLAQAILMMASDIHLIDAGSKALKNALEKECE